MTELDYKEIDFKGGIEIHQQINTRKLFCECPAMVRTETPSDTTKRKLHAVASELGEYDPAALHEVLRDRTFFYQSYRDSVCLVELDEEPPHPVNRKALEVVLQSALMLNARVVDEVQVMRKTVIDGSNTAGFQRTMLIATDGKIKTREGEVTLQYFCLEEDAARIIQTNGREVIYRLDRLGIPLLEIVTGPNFNSPKQAGEVADMLGHIIRSLNVRRGIGSVRQDVNVSTKYGTRIEIKGVQRHKMIPIIMEYEARRQVSLYHIAKDLKKIRKKITLDELAGHTHNATKIFQNSRFQNFRNIITKGGKITAINLHGFKGFPERNLCPNKTLGTELKEQVLTLGIKGIIHSDEDLSRYNISDIEINELKAELDFKNSDAFIIFASNTAVVRMALDKLYKRIIACFDGVPKESRRALADGNSQYMRPLPGEARMYPETDIPPVAITDDHVSKTRKNLPEIIENKIVRISKKLKIPVNRIRKIENHLDSLTYGIDTLKLNPKLVFNILAGNLTDIRRKTGAEYNAEVINKILDKLKTGEALPEAVPEILKELGSGCSLDDAAKSYSGESIDLDAETQIVIKDNVNLKNHPKLHEILMGELMKSLRGKIDGKTIAKKLAENLDIK